MTTETKSTRADLKKMRRQIAAGRAKIAEYQKLHPGEPFPFAKAFGVWKGKVHFSEEDIEAARSRPRDFPE